MADAGFGIFSVAWQIGEAGHQFVLRLTSQRFESLIRAATLVEERPGVRVWQYDGKPSRAERKSHSDLPEDACLNSRVHEIVINPELTLRMVTSLPNASADLAELYAQRTHVKTDLRNMKIVMGAERIQARSEPMFRKELLAAVIAYNPTALAIAATEILPDRPGRRFPREAYPRRPKSDQFKKRNPKDHDQDQSLTPKRQNTKSNKGIFQPD